jgi:glutathione S-transferase
VNAEVVVFGARYSVYVRAVLMALETKNVPYRLEAINIFSKDETVEAYRKLHPFGRIPAFRHGAFTLYETAAINRYIDEAFTGPPLQPATAQARARMVQIMSVTDNYGYRPMVWDIYVERVSNPREGKPVNEALIAASLPKARLYVQALCDLMGGKLFLADVTPTLADFHAAPVFGYFLEAPEGLRVIKDYPGLVDWWERISASAAWRRAVAP